MTAWFIASLIAAGAFPAADSVLGVRPGMGLTEARQRLDAHGTGAEAKHSREGGRKFVWMLNDTDFKSIALEVGEDGEVDWVTGFLRPERMIPFARFAALGKAKQRSQSEAIWNVGSAKEPLRLVAKGSAGMAGVVYLLKLGEVERD